jgi:hypothetical protein
MSDVPDPAPFPALTVLSGKPTPEELAAVVVVLSAVRAYRNADGAAAAPPRSQWAARSRLLRPEVVPGPGAWRASALPR